jgi:hypothetical protein
MPSFEPHTPADADPASRPDPPREALGRPVSAGVVNEDARGPDDLWDHLGDFA